VTINANVNLSVTKNFAGSVDNTFTIINNDLADAVAGSFTGFVGGSSFNADGTVLRIGYVGGTGNDVVLNEMTLPSGPQITGYTITAGGLQIVGSGSSGASYILQANTNLSTTNWINLGPVNADALGAFNFVDAQTTNYPTRFYRLLWP
jgi:hypothetical protein